MVPAVKCADDANNQSAVMRLVDVAPPSVAQFRFYEELNDFLAPALRKCEFAYAFTGTPSVKDPIEAIGVPHTEVDLVLVDGESLDFTRRLTGGERVAVYPVFERLDIAPVTRLRARPLRRTRFVLDVHLGKMARYLRLLGFDALYRTDYDDATIIRLSLDEQRIILTRDRGVLKHTAVTHGLMGAVDGAASAARRDRSCIRSGWQYTAVYALHALQRSAAARRQGRGSRSTAAAGAHVFRGVRAVPGVRSCLLAGFSLPAYATNGG